jgi:aspartate kinase
VAAGIFGPLSAAGVSVDMIIQNSSQEGLTDITFTVSRKDLSKAVAVVEEVRRELHGMKVLHDAALCKVSIIGVGMRNHSGVAAQAFAALYKENINIMLISTSEIKISCLIEEKYTELAVRVLHEAFGLSKSSLSA